MLSVKLARSCEFLELATNLPQGSSRFNFPVHASGTFRSIARGSQCEREAGEQKQGGTPGVREQGIYSRLRLRNGGAIKRKRVVCVVEAFLHVLIDIDPAHRDGAVIALAVIAGVAPSVARVGHRVRGVAAMREYQIRRSWNHQPQEATQR